MPLAQAELTTAPAIKTTASDGKSFILLSRVI
jgi:hypothetical protein